MDYLKGTFAKQFDFNVEEILSCSLDSTVYETKYAGQTAAMKCIQRSPELRDIQSPLIKETLQKHTQLDHPNIVKHICIQEYLTSMAEERTVYRVFLEFCKGGTLTQALKKGVLTPQLLQKWSRNIVDGVAYLHKENYLHGNLNGDNILLSSTDSSTTIAKISGLASTKHLLVKFAESKGTSAVYDNPDSLFMSPEMINGRHEVEMENGQLELRTDIWSVGCIVIQMANGGFVEFHKEECGKVIKICDLQAKFIGSGGFPTVSSTLPDVVKDFVHRCFRHHPGDRPSAADLQNHDFLTCNENEAVKWHLPVIPVQIVNVINRGAEGTVYEARRKDTNETVAIKCITLGNLHPDRKLELLRTKAEIAMALDHPNIVRHIHDQEYPLIQSLEREYQIMMEYCGGDTLTKTVQQNLLSPYLLKKWTKEIVDGLAYLHDRKCVHRDIKGENIIMSSADIHSSSIKIADIGAIRLVSGSNQASAGKGTYPFMSPEMLIGEDDTEMLSSNAVFRGTPTDIWSLGCVVIEMLNGGIPPKFSKQQYGKRHQITAKTVAIIFIINGGLPDIPTGISPEIENFVRKCLQHNPQDRPTATDLKSHQLLTGALVSEGSISHAQQETEVCEWMERRQIHDDSAAVLEHVIIPIQLVKLLASGPQGKVFEGLRTDNQETIAVKCVLLDLDTRTRAAQIKLLRSRCAMMVTLTHPHVVRHLHAQEIPISQTYDLPMYQILMEFCAGPTLHHLVRKVAVTPLLLQKWTRQIVEGIRYLHERRFVHRDIKGANIMMSFNDLNNCQVKIADLGDLHCLKKYATESMEVSHEKGTWAFMSPEMITGRQGHDEALDGTYTLGRRTDIWSLGCVVIEMLNGGLPNFYKNGVKINGDLAVMYFVGTGGMPTIPQNLPFEVDDFIEKCLKRRPYDRPSAEELVQHAFLNTEESRVALWKLPPRTSSEAE